MINLPPGITINTGTQPPSGIAMQCHMPECEWTWAWDPRWDGIPDEEIQAVADQHHQQAHA